MNFEELGRKVRKFSRETVAEVQKMNEVRQLNGSVNETQKQIQAIYTEMGKKLYEQYKEEALAGFETEIQNIGDKYNQIAELKEQIRRVKGVVLCPCCNMEVSAMERFCSNCGNKMPEVFEIVDEDEVADAVTVESEDVTEAVDAEAVEEVAESVAVESEDVTEAAGADVVGSGDVTGAAAETVAEKAADKVEAVAEKAADMAERAAEKVADAAETAADKVETAAEKAVDVAETVAEKAADAAETVAEKAEEAAEKVSDIAETASEKTSDAAEKAADAAEV